MSVSTRYNSKRALQERSGFVSSSCVYCLFVSALNDHNTDILQRTIVAEEAIVKKAGGKYKMLPLFTETTTKIRTVSEKRNSSLNRKK